MTLVIADTSAIIAAYDRASANHERAREELAGCTSIVSPMVLDEVDHLLVARFGKDRSVANLVLDDLLASATEAAVVVPAIELTELEAARRVIEQYRDLRLDLTDALSVVLAARFGVTEILTLDERDFRTLRPLTPGVDAFVLPIQDGRSRTGGAPSP